MRDLIFGARVSDPEIALENPAANIVTLARYEGDG